MQIKKWLLASLLSIISTIVGFYFSEFTKDYRENFSKGKLIVMFEKKDIRLKLTLYNEKNEYLVFNSIPSNEPIYLIPGEYSYSISIGDLLIDQDITKIKKRKESIIKLVDIPEKPFYFNFSIDNNKYGPGDIILSTLYSTKKCFVTLFTHSDGNFEQLGNDFIPLEAFETIMIDKIKASRYKGEDNIIAVATLNNDSDEVEQAISWLGDNRKSELGNADSKWQTRWVTFIVD